MTLVVDEPAMDLGTGHGGMPARRAVVRWAWRLFRREWRQQFLVLALLTTAVAVTTAGLGLVANTAASPDSTFGTAGYRAVLNGSDADADIARARAIFGTVEVVNHQTVAAPGLADGLDVRAQDPNGAFGKPMLRLTGGRYPVGAGEVAVTERTARLFHLQLNGEWRQGTNTWKVVGTVENPRDLLDTFALVAPGQASPPDRVTA